MLVVFSNILLLIGFQHFDKINRNKMQTKMGRDDINALLMKSDYAFYCGVENKKCDWIYKTVPNGTRTETQFIA